MPSIPKPSKTPKPADWNAVKALFESLKKDISTIAEGMADIQPRIVRIEKILDAHTEDIALLKSAVKKNSEDIRKNSENTEGIKADVKKNTKDIVEIKVSVQRIEGRLDTFDQRLTIVETKVLT